MCSLNGYKIVNDSIISLEFKDPSNLIVGSECGQVILIDLRENFKENKGFQVVGLHNGEACKVKYSSSMNYIISGGNDNSVQIFDIRKWKLIKKINYLSAVKAIDIDDNKHRMITGGGTHDKTLRYYDLTTLKELSSKNLDSQISNVFFLPNDLFIASMGYVSNSIELVKLNENILSQKISFESHYKRILYLSKSPCENYALSASVDGCVKLWNLSNFYNKRESVLDINQLSLR